MKKGTSSESQNGQTVSRKQIVEYVEKLREDEEEAAKERIVEITITTIIQIGIFTFSNSLSSTL